MKILFLIPAIGSVYGGTSKSVVELAQALMIQGMTVDLVTTNANGDNILDVPTNCWMESKGIRIQYFNYLGWKDYKFSLSMINWLHQHIQDYNLIHSNAIFSLTNLPFYWHCQLHNLPYLVTPRGMLEPWALAYKAWKKRLFYTLFEKAALQNASALHLLSASEAQRIKPLQLKTPTVILPNGLHREDYETLPSPDRFYEKFPATQGKTLILFLGRIDPKKGLDLLASSFASVHQRFPNTHLIIAGQDNIGFLPTAKNYFAQANSLNAVTFTGMLTGQLKYAALAAADLYVAPSYSEGFSMSVLEGMASGLPCIITTGCNFPETGEAKAAHVVDINSESIAQALIQCLSDPVEAKEMGERARQLVFSDYTWDSIAKKMIEVYDAILNDRPIPYSN